MSSVPNQSLGRFFCPGLSLATLDHGRLAELQVTVTPLPGESWPDACRRLHDVLRDEGATIVSQIVWGNVAVRDEALVALGREFGQMAWPVTWTEGADLGGAPWAGMQAWAVRGVDVEPLEVGGETLGCQYRDDRARQCFLGGLRSDDLSVARSIQAARTFERLETTLASIGMNMSHVVRTWFFLGDILAWYGDFNEVRTEFFRSRRVFDGLVPASTGVGTRNPDGSAVAAAALAVQSVAGQPLVKEVASPAQCPATAYGSSFSRAVEIRSPHCRHILVSGTASIEPGGLSVRPNDLIGQIELTFEVISDLLRSRGMTLADTTRATAYFKSPQGAEVFSKWRVKHGWQSLPIISTVAAVCRDELLFELELDAASAA